MEDTNKLQKYLQQARDYHSIFTSETGKAVLNDLKKSCFFNRTSHVPGDPYSSAFREGMREVILRIEIVIEYAKNPDLIEEKYKEKAPWADIK